MSVIHVAATGFLTLLGVFVRKCVVPEEHVVPVRTPDGHRRLLWPGTNILGPGEEAGPRIDTRPHEVVLNVPNILLHNGLPVTVNLRYTLRLLPKEMDAEALYWGEAQREARQVQILRDALQPAIAEMPRPIVQEEPDSISLAMIFSPFMGVAFDALCLNTHARGRKHLAEQAMHMLVKTLVIESVSLPPALVEAYHDFRRANFDRTAGLRFMQRLQTIAPAMADTSVIWLHRAICSDVPGLREILHEGKFSPPAFATVSDVKIKVSTASALDRSASPSSGAPAASAAAASPTAGAVEQDYPLTPEIMASLKDI